ncbi:MAG: hypothetical protein E6Q60_06075 [Nitrosomonas oligotropha]|uniref:Uncharacterized protein n=1 Tax=Nitrosomonas oligotropha TaxID=42354 RepID=A0A5C7VXF1_9PROT|nr:MAG: hypothetical protein E6Q60_06075 [Nitrosomonas oligotropha]
MDSDTTPAIMIGILGILGFLGVLVRTLRNKPLDNDALEIGNKKIGINPLILLISAFFILLAIPQLLKESAQSFKEFVQFLKGVSTNCSNQECDKLKREINDLTVPSIARAKKKCELLASTKHFEFYDLSQYIFTSDKFTEKYHIRAIATHGNWSDLKCSQNGDSGYILDGIDTSEHRIEQIVEKDGKQSVEYIATAKAKYRTKLLIDKDETLGTRSIYKEIGMVPTYAKPEYQKEFYELMCRYDDYRIVKHFNYSDILNYDSELATQPCVPAKGNVGSQILLAFACKNYTRTLISKTSAEKNHPKVLSDFKEQRDRYRTELNELNQDKPEIKKLCKRSIGEHEHSEE